MYLESKSHKSAYTTKLLIFVCINFHITHTILNMILFY